MKRKHRKGEVVCRCGAYGFPHRMMGGACSGGAFVETTREAMRECKGCTFDDEGECQVVQGRDTTVQCPALQDFIRYHDIRLYGVNANTRIENPCRSKRSRPRPRSSR